MLCASQSFQVTVGKTSVEQARSTESPPPGVNKRGASPNKYKGYAAPEMVIAVKR